MSTEGIIILVYLTVGALYAGYASEPRDLTPVDYAVVVFMYPFILLSALVYSVRKIWFDKP